MVTKLSYLSSTILKYSTTNYSSLFRTFCSTKTTSENARKMEVFSLEVCEFFNFFKFFWHEYKHILLFEDIIA